MANNEMGSALKTMSSLMRTQLGLIVLGLGFLLLPSMDWWYDPHHPWREMIAHLVRDVGISFLVAVIVTYLIELERDIRDQLHLRSDTVRSEMSERLTPKVWDGLDNILQEKKVIRENVDISLHFDHVEQPTALSTLKVEYRYDLRSIVARPTEVSVEHELDYQFRDDAAGLPCFESIAIDAAACGQPDSLYEGDRLPEVVRNGHFRQELHLPARDHPPVVVSTIRRELVHIPGSYNLYVPDFCKGVRLQVRDCPANIAVDVIVRPQGSGRLLKRLGNAWSYDSLMLPGQGLEMKFTVAAQAPQPAKIHGAAAT
jgi:hypothetical protein